MQDVIFKKPHDHLHNIENDKRPLTHLINCIHCESILVGYEVKKKGLHYYRCPKCNGVSVNANTTPKSKRIGANDLYKDFLKGYTLDEDFIPVLKFQIEKLYDYHNDHNKVDQENLMAQKRELEGQLKSLKIRLGLGEIDTETFSFCSLPPYIIAGTFPFNLRDLTSPFDLVFLVFASSEFIKESLLAQVS